MYISKQVLVATKAERLPCYALVIDPVWEQGFTFLVSNPETGVLHIKVNIPY